MLLCLHIVSGCVHDPTAEPRGRNRDLMVCKVKNIYCLALYIKSWKAPFPEQWFPKCGFQLSCTSVIWECFRHDISQAHSRATKVNFLG